MQKLFRVLEWVAKSIAVVLSLMFLVCLMSGHTLRESGVFLWRVVKNPMVVGAAVPTLGVAAEALIDVVPAQGQNRRLIEVGAGSGAITRLLIQRLQPGDMLDVVEVDPGLARVLRQKYGNNPQVRIREMSITDWRPAYQYDAMVMSVPFNSLPQSLVHEIWDHVRTLLKPQAPVSYIEILGVAQVRPLLMQGNRKKEYLQVRAYMKNLYQKYGFNKKTVLANVPPAAIYHVRFEEK